MTRELFRSIVVIALFALPAGCASKMWTDTDAVLLYCVGFCHMIDAEQNIKKETGDDNNTPHPEKDPQHQDNPGSSVPN